jgi:hypothetical protein
MQERQGTLANAKDRIMVVAERIAKLKKKNAGLI